MNHFKKQNHVKILARVFKRNQLYFIQSVGISKRQMECPFCVVSLNLLNVCDIFQQKKDWTILGVLNSNLGLMYVVKSFLKVQIFLVRKDLKIWYETRLAW